MSKPNLDSAYALKTPEDSQRLYAEWAETYDETFAQASGYLLPRVVAETFVAEGGAGPILDVGAGTGLVGEELNKRGLSLVDGTDISPQMLAEAALKDCYENLFEGDLTSTLAVDDNTYSGIVSAGTFTHGHVGPDAFDELLRVATTNALFVISINAAHFTSRGFQTKFEGLASKIQGLTLNETAIYDTTRVDAHASDTALIATFRKS